MMDEQDIIADSEDEDNMMDTGVVKNTMKWDEGISTFGNGNGDEQRTPQQPSSISNFTTRPDGGMASAIVSAFTTPSVTKPPRPRPRPIPSKKKPAEGFDQNSSHTSTFSNPKEPEQSTSRQATNGTTQSDGEFMDLTTAMSSIADRAKTRERRQPNPSSDQQWGEEAYDLSPPPPKKKAQTVAELDYTPGGESSKARGKKGKGKERRTSEVIDISDDDDELNIRRSASKSKEVVPTFPVTSIPRPSELIPTEPIVKPPRPKPRPVPKKPKANPQEPAPNPALDNGGSTPARPPSAADLPSSSSRGQRNPLVDSPLPPSDPPISTAQTAAYSMGLPAIETLPEPPSSNRGPNPQPETDDLFSGDEDMFGPDPVPHVDLEKLPPPPTFFTGSSSQANGNAGLPSVGQEGEYVNLPAQLPSKDPKPKPKKKKVAEEDDEDSEWGAAPPKPKEKKVAKKKAFSEVEVVITSKPPGKGKGERGKKKKDEGASSSSRKGDKAKEVFKSREMIEDSDEDPLLEAYRAEEAGTSMPPPVNVTPNKDKPFDRSAEPIIIPEQELDMVGDDAGPVAKKGNKRKRKSMAIEDDDDFDEGASRKEESANKRQKKGKKAKGNGAGDARSVKTANLSRKQKGKAKAVVISEDEEEPPIPNPPSPAKNGDNEEPGPSKENVEPRKPERSESPKPKPVERATPKPQAGGLRPPRHSIGARAKVSSMSELIKRVNSLPNSPFPVATSSRLPAISRIATSYSPYLKSSRSMLSRIAPLHPNRRTPPPPLPPPPPRKKTKKELEREEKWEEELIDSLGGLEAWIALSDVERKDMRKAKFDMEMGGWDD